MAPDAGRGDHQAQTGRGQQAHQNERRHRLPEERPLSQSFFFANTMDATMPAPNRMAQTSAPRPAARLHVGLPDDEVAVHRHVHRNAPAPRSAAAGMRSLAARACKIGRLAP